MGKKKNKYNTNNINDYTKKKFLDVLTSNMYIFDYKIIMYWLPLLLYVNFIALFIIYLQIQSEFLASFLSFGLVYLLYFIIDIIYQFLLCKNKDYFKLIKNSLENSLYPSIFVLVGYILAILLKDSRNIRNIIDSDFNEEGYNTYTIINKLYNTHINNVIVSVFFYIFSIFYNNPINKKKCINNKLC